jgi:menaquinone-9 beta-reductase
VNSRGADAIIVGGGPAGAATAKLLARAGHDVLVLDRAAFPRPKPCGDCLSAGATPVLRRLGLLDSVHALPHAPLHGWQVIAPGGESFTGHAGPIGDAIAIEREVLDRCLLQAAVAAGARLRQHRVLDVLRDDTGAVCGVATDAGPLYARLVIGADGLRSVVAARLKAVARPPRLRKVSFTLHVDGPLFQDFTGRMHVLSDGCIGIAPVVADGTRWNVTVAVTADSYVRARLAPAAFVAAYLRRVPALEGIARESLPPDAALLRSGPFDRPVRRVVFDGAALAGDAAGYYDPFTGQGVTHALRSAELLAHTADGVLRSAVCSAAALQPYARALRREMRAPRLLQHAVESVISRRSIANRAIARLARSPHAAGSLIAVIGMTAPAGSLLSASVISDLLRRRSV